MSVQRMKRKMNIYFVTSREEKYEELKKVFHMPGYELIWFNHDIPELQTEDEEKLVRHKVLEAFKEIRRPVLVEHSALKIKAFGDLPGLQTRNFYSKLGYQSIVEFCGMKKSYEAAAEAIIGFTDGKKIIIENGIDEGWISDKINITKGFEWDEIFIPKKNNPLKKTYAELGEEKYHRSMRKIAWDKMEPHIEKMENSMNDQDDKKMVELAELIKQRKVMLFVGSGISASVDLPTWGSLINILGEKQGFDKELFSCYGDNMMLAEYADKDRTVYEELKNQFDIDRSHNSAIRDKLEKSAIYEKLLELDFPVIYTTNYDHLIEAYYEHKGKQCEVIKTIDDMSQAPSGVTRIMKFHGDLETEKEIVLAESQYFKRMDFQHFMDIQLQADMLRYKVLFLGYSLSDINIKLLLYLARKRNSTMQKGMNECNSYVFTATPNQVQKEVFEKNGIVSLSGDIADKEQGTLDFLRKLVEYKA